MRALMDEKRIQQVLEIEEKAQEIHKNAVSEAEKSLIQAEKEAIALIEKARAEAEEEASQLVSNAWGQEETSRILNEAEESAKSTEALAMNHLDRAISYVLSRLVRRE